jgi:alpha-L-fucosidase
MNSQRLYNDRKWPNPLVVKLTHVQPAMRPPRVSTVRGERAAGGAGAVLSAELQELGESDAVEVGFQYRRKKATEELLNKDFAWVSTPLVRRTQTGAFTAEVKGLDKALAYEFRAQVKHPLITVFGEEMAVVAP